MIREKRNEEVTIWKTQKGRRTDTEEAGGRRGGVEKERTKDRRKERRQVRGGRREVEAKWTREIQREKERTRNERILS